MHGLTEKQLELLNWLKSRENQDIGPSYEEMKIATGLKSKAGVHRLIKALWERGAITYLPHRSRSVRVK